MANSKEESRFGRQEGEKFNFSINLNKPEKNTTIEKLPVSIKAFDVHEKHPSQIFGMTIKNNSHYNFFL